MNDHQPLVDRLGALGRQDVDPALRSRIMSRLAGTARTARSRHPLRLAVATAVLTAGVPAAAAITAAVPDEVPPAIVPVASEGTGDRACSGAPPFAGDPANDEDADRGEEARAHARFRADECPPEPSEEPSDAAKPHADDECRGAPPFAGEPAEPATREEHPSARSSEARAHAATRAQCNRPDDDASEAPGGGHANRPEDVPAGPPTETPVGPPTDLPVPEDVTVGPPSGTP